MRRSLLAASLSLLAASQASAWDKELLCPAPEALLPASMPTAPLQTSLGDEAMCSPDLPHVLRSPRYSELVADRESDNTAPLVAANAFARARVLERAGAYDDAQLNLRVIEATMPRIADHVALRQGALHARAGNLTRAVEAYQRAMETTDSLDVKARAQVGYVDSLLRAQNPQGVKELLALFARYPELPEGPGLRFELAQYYERAGQWRSAVAGYRTLDLNYPGYPVADRARTELARLAQQGHKPIPYTPTERVERAERLVRSGPPSLAEQAVEELRHAAFPKALVARRDAVISSFERKRAPRDVQVAQPGDSEREKRLLTLVKPFKLAKARPVQLYAWLQQATELGLAHTSDVLVETLVKRAALVPADVRFSALVIATGNASDEMLLSLADTLVEHPKLGVAARYHRARCLERLKRFDAAREELMRVTELDTSATHFYAQFAEQRLRTLNGEGDGCQAPGRRTDCNRDAIESVLAKLERQRAVNLEQLTQSLQRLADEHGEAYPWLFRALDLARIGDLSAAGDELHEAYLAYRWAARRGPLNAGRIAIYRGRSIVQPAPDLATRKARLALNATARNELAEIAFQLGDVGTAVEFGGIRFAESHPEPYADEVARVARKYGLDPDLLFAIMRVESVYHRRIISHAGAIGLMQIMPRTGRLIANELGLRETTAVDLLEPSLNLELSGWYLHALLERMDGRLPLAIASYNGGPHNVRRWIEEFGEHLPLDVFLERIPFAETKRYVRRVLGYYAEYKAARGQNIDLMSLTLPKDKDGVRF